MPYKLRYLGMDVECDTVGEIEAIGAIIEEHRFQLTCEDLELEERLRCLLKPTDGHCLTSELQEGLKLRTLKEAEDLFATICQKARVLSLGNAVQRTLCPHSKGRHRYQIERSVFEMVRVMFLVGGFLPCELEPPVLSEDDERPIN